MSFLVIAFLFNKGHILQEKNALTGANYIRRSIHFGRVRSSKSKQEVRKNV